MLPRLLKGFNVYVDGVNYVGRAETVKLPDLNVATEEYRGGGMDAPVENDMGMEIITCTITFAEYSPAIIKLFGLISSDKQVTIRNALQRQGEAFIPAAVRMTGGVKNITRDDQQQGQKSNMQIVVTCNRYREEQAGETLVDIDVLNGKRIIGGVDQLAGYRTALGM